MYQISRFTYAFTPAEGFVLGGAFLFHDLAMSVAATPGGLTAIYKDPRWTDLVYSEYQSTYDRDPTAAEARSPEPNIHHRAMFSLLRQIHAENAERLAFLSYPASDGTSVFLIDDPEMRQTFGRLIGRIAHSHWWSIPEIERSFSRTVGAAHWCPTTWTIDPLKIACALRVADAAHVDARRAPTFTKSFSTISPGSEPFWRFQEKLNKPYLREDALVFTSGSAFALSEAGSWWLCLETLRTVDRGLRGVDSLFSDLNYPRFAAKSVAGVDLPERLANYIQTDSWLPINATVPVSDLPHLIRSIGGEELYGNRPEVALRELIQNACDAVRARRAYENRGSTFGRVLVSLEHVGEDWWLEVSDDGVGMSQRVLTEFLLDFGRSFWGSPLMQEELPGLLSSGVRSTGKYGIGFFSAFMIAARIQVITRRSDAAAKDTLVLEFSSGLKGRPILRPATRNEQLIDGGTTVRLKLTIDPEDEGGLLWTGEGRTRSLVELCQRICPAIDVDLSVTEKGSVIRAVSANDWETMDGATLLARMEAIHEQRSARSDLEGFRKCAAQNLSLLRSDDGGVFGRACISAGFAGDFENLPDLHGVVTVGGLRACSLSGIVGVLVGQPLRASRDSAKPTVPDAVLKRWAEEQVKVVPKLWPTPAPQSACAQYIRLCGGSTATLLIAIHRGEWVSANDIANMTDLPDEVVLVDHLTMEFGFKLLKSYTLDNGVFITRASGIPGLLGSRRWDWGHDEAWPRGIQTNFVQGGSRNSVTLAGAVIEAVASAWKVPIDELLKANDVGRETNVLIGREGEREIRDRAIRVVRPKKDTLSN